MNDSIEKDLMRLKLKLSLYRMLRDWPKCHESQVRNKYPRVERELLASVIEEMIKEGVLCRTFTNNWQAAPVLMLSESARKKATQQ